MKIEPQNQYQSAIHEWSAPATTVALTLFAALHPNMYAKLGSLSCLGIHILVDTKFRPSIEVVLKARFKRQDEDDTKKWWVADITDASGERFEWGDSRVPCSVSNVRTRRDWAGRKPTAPTDQALIPLPSTFIDQKRKTPPLFCYHGHLTRALFE